MRNFDAVDDKKTTFQLQVDMDQCGLITNLVGIPLMALRVYRGGCSRPRPLRDNRTTAQYPEMHDT
jgi:hypothetical protein